MDEGQKELTAELYRLYWDSDRSVRQIREELDITSAALYQLLEPLPVDVACHVCGGAVGFKNRTARTNREGICLRCGEVMRVPAERAASAEAEAGAATDDEDVAAGEDAAAGEEGAEADGAPPESDPDWVSDAVDDALESTERAVRDVLFVAVGLVAVLAVGVVGLLRRRG